MNQDAPVSVKFILWSLLIGLGIGLAGTFLTPALLLAPAVLAFLLAAWGPWCAGAALAAALCACGLIGGVPAAGYMAATALPAGLIIGLCLRGKKPYRTAVTASAFALGAALYAMLCLNSILAGEDPFYGMRELLAAVGNSVGEIAAMMQAGEETVAAVTQTMALMKEGAAQLTVGYVFIGGMLFGLLDVAFAHALCKKAGLSLKPMAPMPLWQLSKNYTWASLTALVGALAVMLLGLDNADAVFVAAECVVLGPLALMGFCLMDFMTRLGRPGSKGRRIFLYVATLLLLPYSVLLLAAFGLTDRFMKTRRRYKANEK